MTKVDEILELVFDYGDSRQHESADKWSVRNIKAEIEELVRDAERYRFALVTPDYAICVWSADEDGYESYHSLNQVQIDEAMKETP